MVNLWRSVRVIAGKFDQQNSNGKLFFKPFVVPVCTSVNSVIHY